MSFRARKDESEVAIMAVRRRGKGDHFDEICVHCRLGSVKFVVSLPSDEFNIAQLKNEIGRRLLCEFGVRRARSLVGQKIPIAEIIKESCCTTRNPKFWDFF